ncbi:MAG: diguanylate cyclase [Clostridiales bacterium]|nr:diguanylate cyclase [Clostridiales bacterium]
MDTLSDDEHREFAKALLSFGDMVIEMREFARNVSRGNLDVPIPGTDNELAAPLKALHSTLKHLSWQTKQVAQGNYEHEIVFMGEYSAAFNAMIEQLREHQKEHKRHVEELDKANSIFQAITSSMTELIVMVDKDSLERLFANRRAESMLASGISEQQLYDILYRHIGLMENDDEPKKEEFMLAGNTARQYFELMLYPIRWFEHQAVACVLTDVTANKEKYHLLEDIAYRDIMTGVYNRYYGMRTLNQWVQERFAFRLVFVDMDMLKYVNDAFGHAEGDVYIKSVAGLLQEIPGTAIVCRLGGDEFMVLIRDGHGSGESDIGAALESIRGRLADSSETDEAGNTRYNRSISFGIVEVGEGANVEVSDILAEADEKMYEYKKAHKNQRRA